MTSVFEIFAKLGLDSSDFDKGLNNAKSTLSSMGSAVGSGLGTIAKIGTAAVASASAGIAALGTMAVKGYADYEQLVGGIETLFGAGGKSLEEYAESTGKTVDEVADEYNKLMSSQKAVFDNADQAYKNAGLSANEYMNTAIGFSGALLKSLGGDTAKAAEATNMAIEDMADQANKYGKTVDSISETYTSLARGNTQTLDNLFGGMFAGTKAGLNEMLKYAEDYRASLGETVSYSADSYADIVSAIHDVSMATGVYGTTADEAYKTISGSVASMKAAWSNLVAGLANDNADIGTLIDNVVTSAETAFNNILPIAEQALMGIGQLVTDLAPVIGQKLPELITTLLPQIIETGAQFIGALGQGIIDNIPTIVDSGVQIVVQLTNGLVQALPQLAEGAITLVQSLGQSFAENAPQLLDAGMQLVQMIADGIVSGIPILIEQGLPMLVDFSAGLRENAGNLVDAGIDLIMKIADGLIEGLPTMIETIPDIIINIAGVINDNAPKLLVAGVELIGKLGMGIIKAIPTLVANIPKIFEAILAVWSALNWISLGTNLINFISDGVKSLAENIPNALKDIGNKAVEFFKGIDWKNLGQTIINFIKDGITALTTTIPEALKGIGSKAMEAFKGIDWASVGKNVVNGIANGIKNAAGIIANAAKNAAKAAFDAAKDFLGIKSPSKLMRDHVGRYISEGIAVGIEDNLNSITNSMNDVAELVSQPMDVGEVGFVDGSGSGSAYNSSNSVVINVYGAVGQSVNELAEIVSRKINASVNRRGAAWA